MKITILQTDIIWRAADKNIEQVARQIQLAPPSDLYILPEMWNTGFMTEAPADEGDKALEFMKQVAHQHQAAICGSLATHVHAPRHAIFNRHYFVFPDGSFDYYDKRHLFTFGGEHLTYSAGSGHTIVNYRDFRFMLQTCYDLRFPVWSRNQDNYDAIIYVANWPTSRIKVWDILLKARAIENQSYVIGANRRGSDPQNEYNGHSAIINPKGNILAESTSETDTFVHAEINMEELLSFRKKFKVLNDRDSFTIEQKHRNEI